MTCQETVEPTGPQFTLPEAISPSIACDTQDEIDHCWERLSEGGEEGPCGWLKDRFGLSWQVVPSRIVDLLTDAEPDERNRALQAVLGMQKIDIAAVEQAFEAG